MCLLRLKNPEGQVARRTERVQWYDLNSEHRSCSTNCNAVELLKRLCPKDCSHRYHMDNNSVVICDHE